MTSTLYSCVLAEKPHFAIQVMTWAWTLIDLAGVDPSKLVVHAVPGASSEAKKGLSQLGVEIIESNPFHPDNPYCNKLVQMRSKKILEAEAVVLCDTDIAFTRPIVDVISTETIRAKIVDLANPPLETWEEIIKESGLDWPGVVSTTCGDEATVDINFNGGLYVIPGKYIKVLSDLWPRWAEWLIDRRSIIPEKYRKHVDQISFGLACQQGRLSIDPLPLEHNFPTHLGDVVGRHVVPAVLHYHSNVDGDYLLRFIGLGSVDAQIASVNRVISQRRKLDSKTSNHRLEVPFL